jgi:hypothetical protein
MAFIVMPQHAQIAIGAKAGITRLKFSGDSPTGIGHFVSQPGISAGLRFDYRFTDAISVSIQPGFNILKSKYVVLNDSGTAVIDSTYYTGNFFSVPVHAIIWSKNGRFFVLTGFEFSYTMSFIGDPIVVPVISDYDVKKYNIYAQFGAGFIIPLGRPFLSFEVRYSQGLVDFNQFLVHQKTELPRTKLTNINIVVGLQVPLGNSDVYKVKKKNR